MHSDLDNKYICGAIDIEGQFILEVDVVSITFTHHPLFSKEHVVAEQLTELYQTHALRVEQKTEERLSGKLEALRRARDNVRRVLDLSEDVTEELISAQKARLERYQKEIKETRKLKELDGRNSRRLLKSILRTWKDLKKLRQTQGYINTSVKLQIKKEETEMEYDRKLWELEIEMELNELEDEYNVEYNKKYEEYSNHLVEWKKKHKARVRNYTFSLRNCDISLSFMLNVF